MWSIAVISSIDLYKLRVDIFVLFEEYWRQRKFSIEGSRSFRA